MESCGQIDGQMSSQSPVVWWYREVNCEVVGMSVEAVPIFGNVRLHPVAHCHFTFTFLSVFCAAYRCF
jgi:hypothetical protein